MQIGAMNHPGRPLDAELRWMAELKLDFIDLTIEPPCTPWWSVNPAEVRDALAAFGFGVVGHTAYYLPIGSSFESLRTAAIDELKRCVDVFAEIGAPWMNIHPDAHAPFFDEGEIIRRNIESLRTVIDHARGSGVRIMVENVPGKFNSAEQLAVVLEPLPELGLHLDIGHCNLGVERNTTEDVLARFGDRLAHVHLHDNRGGHADLHLALGMGSMDIPRYVRALKSSGYDGTITLEVFSPDPHYLAHSRDRLRLWWNDPAAPLSSAPET
jgi:sugar phosphate isomerase/epimerase